MKRSINMLIGVVAGVLLAGACLYGAVLLWPRLLAPRTVIAVTAVTATHTLAPPTDPPTAAATSTQAATPRATEESPFEREVGSAASATPAALPPAGGGALPVTRAQVQQPFEAEGFDFQAVDLDDGRLRWVAASPDRLALVEIIGSETVEMASVNVFGSLRPDSAAAGRRIVYLLTMLNTVLPGWSDGAAWLGDEALKAAGQAGDYAAETTHNGVIIRFTVDKAVESYTLSFAPN